MIRSKTLRRAASLAASLVAAGGLLATTAAPAAASSVDSSTLVFVPYNGQTFTIWRNGNTATPAYFTTSRVIEGNFGGPAGTDLFLYNPGSGSDGVLSVTANVSSFTSAFRSETISGTYTPVVGAFTNPNRDAVLFYKPGTGAERFISFNANGSVNQLEAPTVNGTYDPEVGDYDGNGYQDIAWATGGKATLWKFNAGGFTQQSITTSTVNTRPATIDNYRFPA